MWLWRSLRLWASVPDGLRGMKTILLLQHERREIERSLEAAKNPIGMTTGTKAAISISTLERLYWIAQRYEREKNSPPAPTQGHSHE